MRITAILNPDGSAVCSYGEPGNMASFEADWHDAVLTLRGRDGSLVRSITIPVSGDPVVAGPDPAAPPAGSKAQSGATGEGFAGLSQHADEVKG